MCFSAAGFKSQSFFSNFSRFFHGLFRMIDRKIDRKLDFRAWFKSKINSRKILALLKHVQRWIILHYIFRNISRYFCNEFQVEIWVRYLWNEEVAIFLWLLNTIRKWRKNFRYHTRSFRIELVHCGRRFETQRPQKWRLKCQLRPGLSGLWINFLCAIFTIEKSPENIMCWKWWPKTSFSVHWEAILHDEILISEKTRTSLKLLL